MRGSSLTLYSLFNQTDGEEDGESPPEGGENHGSRGRIQQRKDEGYQRVSGLLWKFNASLLLGIEV